MPKFYSNLFKSKDNSFGISDISEMPELQNIKKISQPNLGREMSTNELGNVLKKMKNNKSSGIDGLSADFLKVFWGKLKNHITDAINVSYNKGILPVSWRRYYNLLAKR